MTDLRHSETIFIARPPGAVYDMVSDVTRMGEWSPICRACWWDDGAGPQAGSWFTGHNETPDRMWESRSQVEVAEPGREFAFLVNNAWVRWAYTLTPVEGGTELTESWHFLPAGLAGFVGKYGDDADNQIDIRTRAAHESMPLTLAALKAAAEAD